MATQSYPMTAQYQSIGTGPMLISTSGPVYLVAQATQPNSATPGIPLNLMLDGKPFYFPLTLPLWAILQGAAPATITTISN